jgi:isoquinoline 1-oxidoreductase beta subunit
MQAVIAKLLGRRTEAVRLQNHRLGGGFGGRVFCQAAVEAAWLSGAVKRPVRVQWTREEEFRHNAVLQKVAEISRWGSPLPKGVGRGLACVIYRQKSYVAMVAEVEVDEAARSIRVRHVYCAHDCGLVVSPDQVEAQIEGNVAWGCSMSLLEGTTIEDGQLAASNYHDYPVLRFGDMPDVTIALVENADDPPSGAGETALVPMPAAIANAVFAASGKRLRELPLRCTPGPV